MQPEVVSERAAKRAELDLLRSEWREALLAAREALRAEEGVLSQDDLAAHERHLRGEYEAVTAELRQFARDEGLSPDDVEPLRPGRLEVTRTRRSPGGRDPRRPLAQCPVSR